MGLKEIFVSFALVGLVVYGLMSFVVTTQEDNSVANKITDNDIINRTYGNLEDDLKNAQSSSSSSLGNFSKLPPEQEFGDISFGTVFSSGRTIKTMVIGLWNTLIVLPLSVLGVSSIVANIIGAILIILILIGLWFFIRGFTQ